MKRILIVIALVSTGCIPDSEPKEPVKTSLTKPKEPERPAVLKFEFPDTDPNLEFASVIARRLAAREEEIDALVEKVGTALDQIADKVKWDTKSLSPEEILQVVKSIREMGKAITGSKESFAKSLSDYRRTLEVAPDAYERAREYCEGKASRGPEFNRGLYEQLAGQCEEMREACGSRLSAYERFSREFKEVVKRVEASDEVLADCQAVLTIRPAWDGPDAAEKFQTMLSTYTKALGSFRKTFREFQHGVRAKSVSRKLRSEYEAEVARLEKVDEEKRNREQAEASRRSDEERRAEFAKQEARAEAKRSEAAALERERQERDLASKQSDSLTLPPRLPPTGAPNYVSYGVPSGQPVVMYSPPPRVMIRYPVPQCRVVSYRVAIFR